MQDSHRHPGQRRFQVTRRCFRRGWAAEMISGVDLTQSRCPRETVGGFRMLGQHLVVGGFPAARPCSRTSRQLPIRVLFRRTSGSRKRQAAGSRLRSRAEGSSTGGPQRKVLARHQLFKFDGQGDRRRSGTGNYGSHRFPAISAKTLKKIHFLYAARELALDRRQTPCSPHGNKGYRPVAGPLRARSRRARRRSPSSTKYKRSEKATCPGIDITHPALSSTRCSVHAPDTRPQETMFVEAPGPRASRGVEAARESDALLDEALRIGERARLHLHRANVWRAGAIAHVGQIAATIPARNRTFPKHEASAGVDRWPPFEGEPLQGNSRSRKEKRQKPYNPRSGDVHVSSAQTCRVPWTHSSQLAGPHMDGGRPTNPGRPDGTGQSRLASSGGERTKDLKAHSRAGPRRG